MIARNRLMVFEGQPNYLNITSAAAKAAREAGWQSHIFSTVKFAIHTLQEDVPEAFSTFLTPGRLITDEQTAEPEMTVIEKAKELEIPLALITPRAPTEVKDLISSRDLLIYANIEDDTRHVKEELIAWFGKTARI